MIQININQNTESFVNFKDEKRKKRQQIRGKALSLEEMTNEEAVVKPKLQNTLSEPAAAETKELLKKPKPTLIIGFLKRESLVLIIWCIFRTG